MKNKKWLWITLIALDVGITVFLFVIHIIMLTRLLGKDVITEDTGLIGYLQQKEHSVVYLVGFVVPLFIILAANIIGLVFYVKKQAKKEQVTVDNLSEEEKEALKKELLEDLKNEK